MSDFDNKAAEDELSVEEIEELRGISNDIHSLSRVNTSISWQQSRLHWLKDGDANSKYFHSVLSNRRKRNAIVSLMVNGSLVEGVQSIRNAVFSHFKEHFADSNTVRPRIDNLAFKNLSYAEGSSLTKPFSVAEVKAAMWDCVSDVKFLHVIKLFTRKYNRIVSAGSCVFHKCFHNIHHVKCLGINCLFV